MFVIRLSEFLAKLFFPPVSVVVATVESVSCKSHAAVGSVVGAKAPEIIHASSSYLKALSVVAPSIHLVTVKDLTYNFSSLFKQLATVDSLQRTTGHDWRRGSSTR